MVIILRLDKADIVKGVIVLTAVISAGILLVGMVAPFSSALTGMMSGSPEGGAIVGAPTQITTPFRINSDAELDAKAFEVGWGGDGTPTNPYMITNVNINNNYYQYSKYGIYIGNTTKSFSIQGCYIYRTSTVSSDPFNTGAINLYHVQNAKVLSTRVTTAYNGVMVTDCSNITLNILHTTSVTKAGIRIDLSDNVTVTGGNIGSSRSNGIHVIDSRDVLIDHNTVYSTTGDGIRLDGSHHNLVSNNSVSWSTSSQIRLTSSDHNEVRQNTVSGGYGIVVQSSTHDSVRFNTASSGSYYGIQLSSSNNISVEGNQVSSYNGCICSQTSSDIAFKDNLVRNGNTGFYILSSSTRNVLLNNTLIDCYEAGVRLSSSTHNTFYDNNLTGTSFMLEADEPTFTTQTIPVNNTVNERPVYYYSDVNADNATVPLDAGQVVLGKAQYLTIMGLNLSDQNIGLMMGYSSHVLVQDNLFHGNGPNGVRAYQSDHNVLRSNIMEGCDTGVLLLSCRGNLLEHNMVAQCTIGIRAEASTGNVLFANVISDCTLQGVGLAHSNDHVLYGNVLLRCSVDMEGEGTSYASHTIAVNNTVNGRPVYYYSNLNADNATVPLNAGQVILGNVSFLSVHGLNLSDQNVGLLIAHSSHIAVDNNTFYNDSPYGIRLFSTSDTLIEHNLITGSETGIHLLGSDDCTVRHNELDESNRGMMMDTCHGGEVQGNVITAANAMSFNYCGDVSVHDNMVLDCYCGIDLYMSDGLILQGNQFEETEDICIELYGSNGNQVRDNRINGTGMGIAIDHGTDNQVSGNAISNGEYGIELYVTSGNNVTANRVWGCDYGIYVYDSPETVHGNLLMNCEYGIDAYDSPSIIIEGNEAVGCHAGIELIYCDGGQVRNNNISACEVGAFINYNYHVQTYGNDIATCDIGILVSGYEDNVLTANNVTDCLGTGIMLENTEGATLLDNNMTRCAIELSGDERTFTTQAIDTSNTVNGKPVLYYANLDMTYAPVDSNAGQVIMGKVSRALISGLEVDNTTMAILLGYSNNITVDQCSFDHISRQGIELYRSVDVDVTNGLFTSCEVGLLSLDGRGLLVQANDFSNCTTGARSEGGDNEQSRGNNMLYCDTGLHLIDGYCPVVNANIFVDCGVGIRASGEYLDIGDNTIATCASSAILVEDAYEAWVFANEISGGYAGVEVRRCQNAEVCDNVIHHSIVGVNLTFGHENYVYDNWLTDISDNAIRLCDNEAVSVYSNEIEGCAIGIADVQDVGTIVESNIMEACQDGIQVRGSEDSFLALNVISSSAHYGISIALSNLIAVQENTISNSASYGLWVNTSQYVEVSLNRFVDNNGAGSTYDPAHAQAYDDCWIYTDIFGPEIEVYEPWDGQEVDYGYLYTYWEAWDESGVDYCMYRLNGGDWVLADTDGYWYWDDDYPTLEDGSYMMEIRGWDLLGNAASVFINFTAQSDHYLLPGALGTGPAVPSPGPLSLSSEGPALTQWYDDHGNYWSDHLAPDEDRDGHVDVPYAIAGGNNTDMFPLSQLISYPADLTVTPHPFSVELSWSSVNYTLEDGIDGYLLTRNSTSGGNFTVDREAGETYYVDDTVIPYQVYTYTLVAYRGEVSGGSMVVEVMTPDPFPPIIVIDSPSNGLLTNSSIVTVAWTGEDEYSGIDSYWVRLNDGAWTSVGLSTSHTFTGLVQGENVLGVRAMAKAGNVNETSVSVVLDSAPPIVTITVPVDGATVGSSGINATWTGSDGLSGLAGYRYRIDQGVLSDLGAAPNCTLADLDDGAHTLEVMAFDNIGNYATATSRFIVDTTGPLVSVISPSSNANVRVPQVTWQGTDQGAGISHYEYSVDGGAWTNVSNATEHLFAELSEGQHTVLVKVVDRVGLEGIAAVTFTLDSLAPSVTITSPTSGTMVGSSSITWQGSDDGSGLSHYECSVDGGAWTNVSTATTYSFQGLGQGSHTATVRAFDLAGNDHTATVTFILDTLGPALNIVFPSNGSWVNSAVVTWQGDDDGSGLSHYECSVDGGAWTNVSTATTYSFQGLAPAEHTVRIKAMDNAGHNSTASVTFLLDVLNPVLTILHPADGALLISQNADATWAGADAGSGIARYSVRFDGGGWTDIGLADTISLRGLEDGLHAIEVRVLDNAGNSIMEGVSFLLDATAPTVSEHGPTGNNVSLEATIFVTFSETMDANLTNLTVDGLDGTVTWAGRTIAFHPSVALSYGTEYAVHAVGEDVAGNQVSLTWTFRTTNLGTLMGRIVDAEGNPVMGATVTLDTGVSTMTNETGWFSFLVEAGEHDITVTKNGYLVTFSSASLAPGQVLTLSALTLTAESNPMIDWWPVIAVSMGTAALFISLFAARRRGDGKG